MTFILANFSLFNRHKLHEFYHLLVISKFSRAFSSPVYYSLEFLHMNGKKKLISWISWSFEYLKKLQSGFHTISVLYSVFYFWSLFLIEIFMMWVTKEFSTFVCRTTNGGFECYKSFLRWWKTKPLFLHHPLLLYYLSSFNDVQWSVERKSIKCEWEFHETKASVSELEDSNVSSNSSYLFSSVKFDCIFCCCKCCFYASLS